MPPKFCPECRDEFIHAASVCPTCDVPLVLEPDLADDEPDELPPISELVCIRASAIGWAMALSEKLSAAGIPHRVQAASTDEDGSRTRPGQNLPYGVFVLAADVDVARRIDAEHTVSEIPDLENVSAPDDAVEGCPACGEPVDADAEECPSCGLAFLAAD